MGTLCRFTQRLLPLLTLPFAGSCDSSGPDPGVSLRVVTATSGRNLDPNGYEILLDRLPARSIGVNGEITFSGLERGAHDLRLTGMSSNCGVELSQFQLEVEPPLEEPVQTFTFQVTCFESLTGRIAFVSDRDGTIDLYVMNADGSDLRRLTADVALDGDPAWAPGSRALAFESDRDGNLDIYAISTDGSRLQRLTSDPAHDLFPAWSPDGKRIAFTTDRDGNFEIYVMNADGTATINLTRDPGDDRTPSWSPDGTRIAFVHNSSVYTVSADGTGQPLLMIGYPDDNVPGYGASDPVWSPDGQRIAFSVSYEQVYIVDATGTGRPVATGGEAYPTWSPDGTKLAYRRSTSYSNEAEIQIVNVDGSGGSVNVTNNRGYDSSPAWAP